MTAPLYDPRSWDDGYRTGLRDHRQAPLLDRIAAMLDGQVWTPDTLDQIAAILRAAGYQIREPEEA